MQLGRNSSKLISEVSITLMPKSEWEKKKMHCNKIKLQTHSSHEPICKTLQENISKLDTKKY